MQKLQRNLRRDPDLARFHNELFDGYLLFVEGFENLVEYFLRLAVFEAEDVSALVADPAVPRLPIIRVRKTQELLVRDPALDFLLAAFGQPEAGNEVNVLIRLVLLDLYDGVDVGGELFDLSNRVIRGTPAFLGLESVQCARDDLG